MKLSPQQEQALASVSAWFRAKEQPIFRVFGYAGAGKSTIAKRFADLTDGVVLFACYTGKACHVLRNKGCPNVSTIHSLIYNARDKSRQPLYDLQAELKRLQELEADVSEIERAIEAEKQNLSRPAFDFNEGSKLSSADLLVVDECSMVSGRMADDLLSFGVPILVLGDPGQLPPIEGRGYFTQAEPDVMLTEIHRQARDNPIIDMATRVRLGERLPEGNYGSSLVVNRRNFDKSSVTANAQILCGLNKTRIRANHRRRQILGFTSEFPESGDRLVCLRNNHDVGLLNGAIWEVVSPLPAVNGIQSFATYRLRSTDDGKELDVEVHKKLFRGEKLEYWEKKAAEEFDYGYCLTVHKGQGSQWEEVFIVDETRSFPINKDPKRWLYTAITRASEKVTLIR